MMLDCCIIGAGASWLFLWMHLPRDWNKLILEKNATPGTKILLSGKGRCNFTNLRASFKTYLWDQTERIHKILGQFWPQDMIRFLDSFSIWSKQEDNGRMLLESNKSKQLVDFLVQKNQENLTQIQYSTSVSQIQKTWDFFTISTSQGSFQTKRVVIATWGMSFPKVWGSDFIFQFAKDHNLSYQSPAPALCGLNTKEDFSSLSWSSVEAITKFFLDGKQVYQDDRVVLFTHRGVSWPAIFNTSLWLGYFDPNFSKKAQIKITIPANQITKRLLSYLKAPRGLRTYTLTLTPTSLRSYDESKVMSWGLNFSEVDDNFQLHKFPWCYVLGEALNITGKTWGYNLQRCRSSAFVCAKSFKEG